jgi:hypothetical protein
MRIVSFGALLLLCACDSGGGQYQDDCVENADCEEGLECVPTFRDTGTACEATGSICNKRCSSDADCQASAWASVGPIAAAARSASDDR